MLLLTCLFTTHGKTLIATVRISWPLEIKPYLRFPIFRVHNRVHELAFTVILIYSILTPLVHLDHIQIVYVGLESSSHISRVTASAISTSHVVGNM